MESILKTAFPFVVYTVAVLIAFQMVLMIVAYRFAWRAGLREYSAVGA